ncbi:MAG: MFS transporter [Actinomycetota bacterium]
MKNAFRALRTRNYRLFFTGQLVSLMGTWMQIVAQAWLVLELGGGGLEIGILTALQFGPTLLGGVWGGLLADRLPKRKILLVTQVLFAVLATGLATLTASGAVELWMVYAFAFVYGSVQVADIPARQAFVSEMVRRDDVMNAVSLNSAIFNAARMVGPAVAGLLIAGASLALCFYINAASYIAVLLALTLMRDRELHVDHERPERGKGQIREGMRYVRADPQLWMPIVLMGIVSMLGLNFQIVLPLLAKFTYGGGPTTFGTLTAVLAFGSLLGALFAGTRKRASMKLLVGAAVAFGALEIVAALAPSLGTAYVALGALGVASMLYIATSNSAIQLNASPQMRGRAMSLFVLVLLGSTPIGGPLVGWIAETWSPRAALGVGGVASLAAALVAGAFLAGRRRGERQAPAPVPIPEEVLAAEAS